MYINDKWTDVFNSFTVFFFYLSGSKSVAERVDRVVHVNPTLNRGEDECKIGVKTDLQPVKGLYGNGVLYRTKG